MPLCFARLITWRPKKEPPAVCTSHLPSDAAAAASSRAYTVRVVTCTPMAPLSESAGMLQHILPGTHHWHKVQHRSWQVHVIQDHQEEGSQVSSCWLNMRGHTPRIELPLCLRSHLALDAGWPPVPPSPASQTIVKLIEGWLNRCYLARVAPIVAALEKLKRKQCLHALQSMANGQTAIGLRTTILQSCIARGAPVASGLCTDRMAKKTAKPGSTKGGLCHACCHVPEPSRALHA